MNGVLGKLMRTSARRRLYAALVLGIAVGCSSEDSTDTPAVDAADESKVVETPDAKAEGQSAATIAETSDEAHAAQAAFRTMTTQNITPAEWEAAQQRLQEIGPPALPVLLEGLRSPEPIKREMASTVLAWFGLEAATAADQLIAALDDESSFVRANVATTLLQIPDQVNHAVPVLAEFLQSDQADLRRMAATNLAAVDIDQARPLMPQLIAALDDEDREVVYYAAQLLGRMGPDAAAALPKLRALETSDDAELHATVTTAVLLIEPEGEMP